jgi:hypothetical protein
MMNFFYSKQFLYHTSMIYLIFCWVILDLWLIPAKYGVFALTVCCVMVLLVAVPMETNWIRKITLLIGVVSPLLLFLL